MEGCERMGVESVNFRVGDPVHYSVPVIESALKYHWEDHVGVVRLVNDRLEHAMVVPSDEPIAWRIVPLVYLTRKEGTAKQ